MLLFFYGTECEHCEKMLPLVERLEREHDLKVERLECWHNDENVKKLEEYDKGNACGGVPYFYNTLTKAAICGEDTYENICAWAGDPEEK